MMNDQLLNMKQELIQTPPSLLTQVIIKFEIIAKKRVRKRNLSIYSTFTC